MYPGAPGALSAEGLLASASEGNAITAVTLKPLHPVQSFFPGLSCDLQIHWTPGFTL